MEKYGIRATWYLYRVITTAKPIFHNYRLNSLDCNMNQQNLIQFDESSPSGANDMQISRPEDEELTTTDKRVKLELIHNTQPQNQQSSSRTNRQNSQQNLQSSSRINRQNFGQNVQYNNQLNSILNHIW